MNTKLKEQLIGIAREKMTKDDPSHDIQHALRVLKNAEMIGVAEKADMDVVVPAALFHDIVIYPKNDPRSKMASDESADMAKKILKNIPEFPPDKIPLVHSAIKTCSFSKGILPTFLEGKIIQDADGLEATGVISIMRTFASCGQMKRPFYHPDDPFCTTREASPLDFSIDLFYKRLLKIVERTHTKTGKKIARRRTKILKIFLKELNLELQGK